MAEVYRVTDYGFVDLVLMSTLQDPSPADGSRFGYVVARGRRGGSLNRDDLVFGVPEYEAGMPAKKAGKVVIFYY